MINLISYEKRGEIKAGRFNVIIRRYIIITIAAALLLMVIIGASFITLNSVRANAQQRLDQSAEAIAEYNDVKARADVFQSNLQVAKSIFDSEVAYSKAYTRIASAFPSGVVISELTLDSSSAGKPMQITAQVRTERIARDLKNELQSHPDVFSNVFFGSITTGNGGQSGESSSSGSGAYPYTVTLTATLSSEIYK